MTDKKHQKFEEVFGVLLFDQKGVNGKRMRKSSQLDRAGTARNYACGDSRLRGR